MAMSEATEPTVLVYRALGLGDLLTAVPALRGLSRARSDHGHVLACPRWLHPLLPAVGNLTGVDAEPFHPLPHELHAPALAVNMHGCGPRSHTVLRALAPERLVAYPNRAAGWSHGPDWRDEEHEVDRWARLVEWDLRTTVDRSDIRLRGPAPSGGRRRLAVVHPGASDPARRWPAERFGAVARELARQGFEVAVTGSAAEATLTDHVRVAADLPPDADRAGATDLTGLADLVWSASVTISADTGLAHLATAFGTPSVVLFGPESPARWGPPAEHPHHLVYRRGVPAAELDVNPTAVADLALDLVPHRTTTAAK